MSLIERLDRFQRGHPKAGLPIAVFYKFADDQGNYLAALITFYGFLSLVPLLLLSSTILNFTLEGHPDLQRELFDSVLGQFPIVGTQLSDPNGVSGSGLGLAIGIVGTIYGGLGAAQAIQNAMNTVWRVPRNSRPNPLTGRLRSILLMVVLGLSILGTTALAAIGSTVDAFPGLVKVVIGIGTFAINLAVFTVGFRLATARDITLGQTLPGSLVAAAIWQALQYVGAIYISSVVRTASEVDSVFALVLGLMAWLYLESLVVVLAVEFNTVRSLNLYPRSLLTPFTDNVVLTAADEMSYTQQAQAQRAKGFQQITVNFDPAEDPAEGSGGVADDGREGEEHDGRPGQVGQHRRQDAP
ncbi:MAG: YihY/virulence factor BrkB family protein [Jatrophihabitans sp.]